ncbi:MAG: hypothetical protein ACTS6G_02805 [Candidatus Hodgkinia cicadicola]
MKLLTKERVRRRLVEVIEIERSAPAEVMKFKRLQVRKMLRS